MSRTLLLADDSATIQRVLQLTFSGEDVRIVAVGDGEQAISRLALEQPDIVLADIGMSKRNGYDLAAFIKGQPQWQHIPVLLLAGAFEPVDQARAEQARCDGVLVKPFEPRQVVARVRELLDGAKGHATTAAAAGVDRPVDALTPRPQGGGDAPAAAPAAEPPPVVDGDLAVTAPAGLVPEVAVGELAQASDGPHESGGAPLDDYLDRLDARFATRPVAAVPAFAHDAGDGVDVDDAEADVPTLERVLGLPDGASWGTANSVDWVPGGASPAGSLVRDAFDALLAIESGDPGAALPAALSAALPGPPAAAAAEAPAPAPPVVTDAFIDEVVARVVARLAPDLVRQVVADVVSDVAERLVREEIARIRAR